MELHSHSVLLSLVHTVMLRGHQSYSYLTPFFRFWELKCWWLHLFVLFFLIWCWTVTIYFLAIEVSVAKKCSSRSASLFQAGEWVENLNSRAPKTWKKLWIISFLSLLHASLLWAMLWNESTLFTVLVMLKWSIIWYWKITKLFHRWMEC